MKPLKMTSNTVFYYIRFTENEPVRDSTPYLSKATRAFWEKTGLEPEEIRRTQKGKPYFPSGRVHLSVTHTGNLFVAAFSPRPIGIDGERADQERVRVAEKKFFPEERLLPFSYVWCGKEAVSKLVGTGMEMMMQVKVSRGRARYDGRGFLLKEMLLGEYRLVTATEEGWNYGAETLSEK